MNENITERAISPDYPLVSVIIPVYNAEKTVSVTLDALIAQTYRRLELIFINDHSSDRSAEVLGQYTDKILPGGPTIVHLISHEYNQGVAAARNTGLAHATGHYIYYVDADDYIEPNAIELLVEKALETDADIVGCNWYLSFGQNERKMNQPRFRSAKEAVQSILNGTMRWNLWLFMVRRNLYEDFNIRFIPGMNMGEDLMVMTKLFMHASKVAFIDLPLYHYGRSNEESLTKTYSEKHMAEVTHNVHVLEEYLYKEASSSIGDEEINYLKLNIKLPLLISDMDANYKRWKNWFSEANGYVLKNRALPFRTRLLQWMALKNQYWFLKLYYHCIIRYRYGIVYK